MYWDYIVIDIFRIKQTNIQYKCINISTTSKHFFPLQMYLELQQFGIIKKVLNPTPQSPSLKILWCEPHPNPQ